MKLRVSVGLVAIFAVAALPFTANSSDDIWQPESIRQVTFEMDDYSMPSMQLAQNTTPSESPSDLPVPVVEEDGEPTPAIDLDPAPCYPQCRKPLRRARKGLLCDLDIGGWVQAGTMLNAHGDASSNGPLGFNDDPHFNMHQLWLYAHKDAQTGGCLDFGYGIDYVFGTDGPDTQAFGDETWDFGWDNGTYGSAIPQLYGEVAYGDLKVKMGHFYTIIGYEVVQAPDNFFYSHAYTMYYGEPFTHTGFLAEYAMDDCITLMGGWVNGWDNGWNLDNTGSMMLGGVSVSLTDDASLIWAFTAGEQGPEAANNTYVYMNSIVFDWQVTDRLQYILQHDMGNTTVRDGGTDTPSNWWGLNQYFIYNLACDLDLGLRFEWFRDQNGTRVPVNANGDGNVGNYYAITTGLNWRPCDNFVVRPEVRYDTFDGNTANGRPFASGGSSSQFSGGCDFIVSW